MQKEVDTSVVKFSQRKKDHIDISLRGESQAWVDQFSQIELQHNPIPEINFEDVSLATHFNGMALGAPLFISSMTLGHEAASSINQTMMKMAQEKSWMMGVGSQRRQLFDPTAARECESLRQQFPKAVLFGNIGLSQVIHTPVIEIQKLVDSLQAQFMVVHTNPLQEALQTEGTPQFAGGLEALQNLCSELKVPVVFKETGCGFSKASLRKLSEINISALDVSGKGGTHWGRVETLRQETDSFGYQVGQSFNDWGISTVDSLKNAMDLKLPYEVWASGGVRNGIDAVKLLCLGATQVGLAQPILKAAMAGEKQLLKFMNQLEQELKVAMFCLGFKDLNRMIGSEDAVKWK